MRLELHVSVIAQYSMCVCVCVKFVLHVWITTIHCCEHNFTVPFRPSSPPLPQVVIQHGGRVLEEYDPEQCTHLLALHKKSDVFAKASRDTPWNEANWLLLH